jgi:hypothetical protein
MAEFVMTLSQTAEMWQRAVAPIAERVARKLWLTTRFATWHHAPATRLTQNRKRKANALESAVNVKNVPRPDRLCRGCGVTISREVERCAYCATEASKERILETARTGRIASHTPEAEAKRFRTQARQRSAKHGWSLSSLPGWLNSETYLEKIQPLLVNLPYTAIAKVLDISVP